MRNEYAGGHERPRHDEAEDEQSRILPLQPPKPVMAPGCDSGGEQKDIRGKVTELQAKDVYACGNELSNRERGQAYAKMHHDDLEANKRNAVFGWLEPWLENEREPVDIEGLDRAFEAALGG